MAFVDCYIGMPMYASAGILYQGAGCWWLVWELNVDLQSDSRGSIPPLIHLPALVVRWRVWCISAVWKADNSSCLVSEAALSAERPPGSLVASVLTCALLCEAPCDAHSGLGARFARVWCLRLVEQWCAASVSLRKRVMPFVGATPILC